MPFFSQKYDIHFVYIPILAANVSLGKSELVERFSLNGHVFFGGLVIHPVVTTNETAASEVNPLMKRRRIYPN